MAHMELKAIKDHNGFRIKVDEISNSGEVCCEHWGDGKTIQEALESCEGFMAGLLETHAIKDGSCVDNSRKTT